jgi:Uncharacterized conserved protein
MKIFVDGMLGNIAKWLRLLGLDVFYVSNIDDDELLKLAKGEKGVLITKDEELSYKAVKEDTEVILVKGNHKIDTIKYILEQLKINTDELKIGSRCMECNTPLSSIDKSEINSKLPKRILESNDEFWICKKCDKIYWHGSHWRNIERELKKILK